MTNDEKAKAYEMALEAARKELGVDRKEWEVVQRVLHNIFSELAESEDERIRKKIIDIVKAAPFDEEKDVLLDYLEKQKDFADNEYWRGFGNGRDEVIDNPDMFNLQEKQKEQKPAWSEEDTDMLNCCISSIEEAKENRYAYKETDGDTSYDREIAWLKSLRPSWKPSEEQMRCFDMVLCDEAMDENVHRVLVQFREQLKRLM